MTYKTIRDEILRLLTRSESGFANSELCTLLKLDHKTVTNVLQNLRRNGAVICTAQSTAGLWCLPDNVIEARAEAARKRTALRKAREKRRYRLAKERRAKLRELMNSGMDPAMALLSAPDPGESPFRRVIVSASDAPPLGRVGPPSVFDLAGWCV